VTALPSPAATWHVTPDGTGDAPTIQAAVDSSTTGDIIELADGTFTGEGNRDLDCQGKAVTIRSQSDDFRTCILDCEGSASTPHRGFVFTNGEGPDTVLRGLTIANGYADKGGGMSCCSTCAPTVMGCMFRDNFAEFSGGGIYSEQSGVHLVGCLFWANGAGGAGGGIDFDDASVPNGPEGSSAVLAAVVENCTLVGNETAPGRGAGMEFEALGITVSNTIVAFSPSGMGVSCFSGGDPVFTCCDVFGNAGGDAICGTDGGDNFALDPMFCDLAGGDFAIYGISPCAPANSGTCGLIGALPPGCGPTNVEPASWGAIKAMYR
jgi:predicted outer membrane repeat protein